MLRANMVSSLFSKWLNASAEVTERGPFVGISLPAVKNHRVEFVGAASRLGKSLLVQKKGGDLRLGHSTVGLFAVRKDLPHQDTVRPNVAFHAARVLGNGFGSRPRQSVSADVIFSQKLVIITKVLTELEVADFHFL